MSYESLNLLDRQILYHLDDADAYYEKSIVLHKLGKLKLNSVGCRDKSITKSRW